MEYGLLKKFILKKMIENIIFFKNKKYYSKLNSFI